MEDETDSKRAAGAARAKRAAWASFERRVLETVRDVGVALKTDTAPDDFDVESYGEALRGLAHAMHADRRACECGALSQAVRTVGHEATRAIDDAFRIAFESGAAFAHTIRLQDLQNDVRQWSEDLAWNCDLGMVYQLESAAADARKRCAANEPAALARLARVRCKKEAAAVKAAHKAAARAGVK